MPNLNHYGAGLAHAWIKNSNGDVYDIEAINDVSGSPAMDDVPVNGDDELKATFYFNQREELELVANAISFDVLQAITGNSYSSSAAGIEVPLGTDSEQNPPYVEVGIEVTGKNKAGDSVTIRKIWHKVQLGTPNIDAANGQELNVTIPGVAYKTDADIEDAALSPARVATLNVLDAS